MASAIVNKLRRVARVQYRAAANEVAMRLPERALETPYQGWILAYPSRSMLGRAVADGVVWDAHLLGVLDDLPQESVVCEVGSNIGASLLTMARARGDLRFICFEPSPRFLPYLRRNVSGNGLDDRVTIEHALIGPDRERWTLTSNTSAGSVVSGDYDRHMAVASDDLTAVSLDSYFDDRRDPSFVKVDTDGFELRVLRSAERLLRRSSPVLFLEYAPSLLARLGDDPDDLRGFLRKLGYARAEVYEGDGILRERDHPLTEPLQTDHYVDLVVRHGPAA